MLNQFTRTELNADLILRHISMNDKHSSKDGKDGKEGKDDRSAAPDTGGWV